jgi:hypothetical protein
MFTLLALLACDSADPDAPGPRVAMVGIDGGDWDILDPMIERGQLPNLARIRQGGCTAPLVIDSPQSPNSWTSIATGHHPEEHGIQQGNSGVGGTFSASQQQVAKHRIWDMSSRFGKSALVVNYWITAPAYAINGVMLAREDRSTFPAGVDVERDVDVVPRVHAEHISRMGVGLARSGSMKSQLRGGSFDLIVLPFYGHDQALHMLYAEWSAAQNPARVAALDEATRTRIQTGFEIVEETARLGDEMLGWAFDYVGDEGYVVLFSDHGHTEASPNQRRIALNRGVLDGGHGTIEHGELSIDGAKVTVGFWVWKPEVNPLGYQMRVPRLVIEGDEGGALKARLLETRTDEGAALFRSLDDGVAVTQEVMDACVETLGKYEGAQFSCFVNSGGHGIEDLGIFGVAGPGVKAGPTSTQVESVDITPTVLWRMGLPTGADLAGSPVTDCFSQPEEVKTIPTYENGTTPWRAKAPALQDEVELQEWLKSMGYMD